MAELWNENGFYLALFLTAPILIIILVYVYLDRTYTYWIRKGVPQINPTSFIYGNVKDMFWGKDFGGFGYQKIYDQLKGHAIGGFYEFINPVLMVRDPQIIQAVLVEKFNNFHEPKFSYHTSEEYAEDLIARHVFFRAGSRWKESKSVLSAGFTPNKLRHLEEVVRSVYEDMSDYLNKNSTRSIKVHEMTSKFTCEVVATWGWGIHADGFSENSMIKNIFDNFKIHSLHNFIMNLWILWPAVGKLFKVRFFSKELNSSLLRITEQAIKNAEQNKNSQSCLLQTILHMRDKYRNNGKDMTVMDITGYMATFYNDGYLTSANHLDLVLYHLMLYPDIQQKVQEEMSKVTTITVDAVKKLEYTDMVLSELERFFTLLPYIGRICTESCTLGSTVIEVGTNIVIPSYAIHHDPEYYPNPYTFNPENFSEENVSKRSKYTYLPFGHGPRMCLGMKHVIIVTKLMLCHLLKDYEILPPKDKPARPVTPTKCMFTFQPDQELFLQFKKLN